METGGSEAGPQSLDTGVNEGPRAGRAPGEASADSLGKGAQAEQGGAAVPRAGEVRLPVTCGPRCMSAGNWGAGTGVPRGRVRTQGGGENTGVRCHAERHESLGGRTDGKRKSGGRCGGGASPRTSHGRARNRENQGQSHKPRPSRWTEGSRLWCRGQVHLAGRRPAGRPGRWEPDPGDRHFGLTEELSRRGDEAALRGPSPLAAGAAEGVRVRPSAVQQAPGPRGRL